MSTGPSAKAKPEGLLGLSLAEARTLLLGILCTDNSGKVDFQKLAEKGNYKNTSSSSSSYRQVKRKLLDSNAETQPQDGASGTTSTEKAPSTPKKKKSLAKRKKAAAVESDAANADENDAPVTPKPKRQRKTPVKKRVSMKKEVSVKVEGGDDDADSDFLLGEFASESEPEAEGPVKIDHEATNAPIKTEDDKMLADVNIDAEFEAMEEKKSQVVKGEQNA